MYRKLSERFRDGSLRPTSKLNDLPHIGPYLYERLHKTYRPNSGDITVRQFVKATKLFTTAQLKASLQASLKNERANLCVGKRDSPKYHVSDVNEMGFCTMVALLRVLKANGDGYNLAQGMVANPANIPYPKMRTEAAKYGPCKGKTSCKASKGLLWKSKQCIYKDASGFQGISILPGQQIMGASTRTLDNKERLARKVAGVSYVAKNTHTRQRVPGKPLDLT